MSTAPTTLAALIEESLSTWGYSQHELADRCHVTRQRLWTWRAGASCSIRAVDIAQVARGLRVTQPRLIAAIRSSLELRASAPITSPTPA